MEFDNIDEEATTSLSHFCAGALAGTMEHTGMYPIDTVKVWIFLLSTNQNYHIINKKLDSCSIKKQ